MYIPKELIWWIIGFISFPIICYIIYIFKYKKSETEEEK